MGERERDVERDESPDLGGGGWEGWLGTNMCRDMRFESCGEVCCCCVLRFADCDGCPGAVRLA